MAVKDADDVPIANPDDVEWLADSRRSEGPLFLMWAGAYGDNKVYVWADSFDSAWEEMVEFFDDQGMKGIFSCIGEAELKEAAEDLGYDSADIKAFKRDGWPEDVIEQSEIDMTIVGHTVLKSCPNGLAAIPSWEWGGNEVKRGGTEWDTVVARSYAESED